MAIRTPQRSEQRLDVAAAGEKAQGDHVCADCGYGVAAVQTLPACPMCRGTSWLPQLGRRAPGFTRST